VITIPESHRQIDGQTAERRLAVAKPRSALHRAVKTCKV